jgi:hypothetical protein
MGVPSITDIARLAYHSVVHSVTGGYDHPTTQSPAELLAIMRRDMHKALQRMDEEDKTLSPKTVAERKAGRRNLVNKLRGSIIDVGYDELKRRFGKAALFQCDGAADSDTVTVTVRAGNNKPMTFTDHIMEFPSEMLIAQVTLLAG